MLVTQVLRRVQSDSMDTGDTIAFIKEREEKLGAPLKFRTYAPWFAKLGGEKRTWGVFLYSDGKTMVYEDFDRDPMILGIPIPGRKNKEKYIKLEASFPVSSIVSVDRVTRSSAEKSLERGHDVSKTAGAFSKALRKLVSKITLEDGTVFFLEIMDHRKFVSTIMAFQKEESE